MSNKSSLIKDEVLYHLLGTTNTEGIEPGKYLLLQLSYKVEMSINSDEVINNILVYFLNNIDLFNNLIKEPENLYTVTRLGGRFLQTPARIYGEDSLEEENLRFLKTLLQLSDMDHMFNNILNDIDIDSISVLITILYDKYKEEIDTFLQNHPVIKMKFYYRVLEYNYSYIDANYMSQLPESKYMLDSLHGPNEIFQFPEDLPYIERTFGYFIYNESDNYRNLYKFIDTITNENLKKLIVTCKMKYL